MQISAGRLYFWLLHIVVLALAIDVVILARQNKELKEIHTPSAARLVAAGDTLSFNGLNLIREGRDLNRGNSSPRLVYVFTTSCPWCRKNIQGWKRTANEFKKLGTDIIGISLDDSVKTINYIHENELNYPVAVPSDPRVFQASNRFASVPITIVATSSGIVKQVWSGALSDAQFQEVVGSVLKANSRFNPN